MFAGRLLVHLIPQRLFSACWLLALAICLCSGPLNAQTTEQERGAGALTSQAAAKKGLVAAGTSNTYVLTVHEVEFAPIDSSTTYEALAISGVTELRETTAGTHLLAPVHLPSGAVIDYIVLHGCDLSTTNVGTVTLYDCLDFPSPAACTGLATVSTVASAGCNYWLSGAIGATVENHTDDYTLRTDWPNDSNLGLRAVKVLYHLQVSPPPGTADFGDVPPSNPQFQFIEALFQSGITAGCGGGNYCPDNPVTRGQMAVFLAKALGLNWPL
jgi:hypothetical protein